MFDGEVAIVREDEIARFVEENSCLLREGKVTEVESNIKYIDIECFGLGLSNCVVELKTLLFEELIKQEEIDALVLMIEQMEMEEILNEIESTKYPILKKVVKQLDQSIWFDYDSNPEFVKWMQNIMD